MAFPEDKVPGELAGPGQMRPIDGKGWHGGVRDLETHGVGEGTLKFI